jgi:hypothetical protein
VAGQGGARVACARKGGMDREEWRRENQMVGAAGRASEEESALQCSAQCHLSELSVVVTKEL